MKYYVRYIFRIPLSRYFLPYTHLSIISGEEWNVAGLKHGWKFSTTCDVDLHSNEMLYIWDYFICWKLSTFKSLATLNTKLENLQQWLGKVHFFSLQSRQGHQTNKIQIYRFINYNEMPIDGTDRDLQNQLKLQNHSLKIRWKWYFSYVRAYN